MLKKISSVTEILFRFKKKKKKLRINLEKLTNYESIKYILFLKLYENNQKE